MRELIAFLLADGQVGFQPAISTDVSRECLATAYQSPEMRPSNLEEEKFILARREGPMPRGHSGSTAELAQRAKVGCFAF